MNTTLSLGVCALCLLGCPQSEPQETPEMGVDEGCPCMNVYGYRYDDSGRCIESSTPSVEVGCYGIVEACDRGALQEVTCLLSPQRDVLVYFEVLNDAVLELLEEGWARCDEQAQDRNLCV